MTLEPGTRIGAYDVVALLGEGGMGRVYRARDTKLNRDVALKVLPVAFAADPDRLARFDREAKTLASLSHPNIAGIYGVEQHALVMEFVEGEDLSAQIARGPMPLDDALPIARQIADALEAAHESGIVHRDLKPANIKIRRDGTVKVLDFGLAKALTPDLGPVADSQNSPTITAAALAQGFGGPDTQRGMILGTAAYMSPEQAKGRPVDRRADLWAFGVVLFEMLTGRRAFNGGDVTEILASVIKDAPALEQLPPDTPPSIRRLLRRCLQKDRRDRIADASTARLEIAEAMAGDSSVVASAPAKASAPSRAWLVGCVAAVAALSAAGAWRLKPAPVALPAPLSRFSITLPLSSNWTRQTHHVLAMSPDGTRLAYVLNSQLYVRRLDQFDGAAIASVRDPSEVFFSADGEWIGFYAGGKLQKVPVAGGTPMTICASASVTGAFWTADDWILFSTAGSILRVRASAGTPETLMEPTTSERFASPRLLANGKALLYSLSPGGTTWGDGEIVVQNLETKTRTTLVKGGSDPRYLPAGFLIFGRSSDLYAVPFDANAMKVTGAPAVVINGVAAALGGLSGAYQYAVSETGSLAYIVGSAVTDMQLAWLDRAGHETPIAQMPGARDPRPSPDGQRLAFSAVMAGNMDIYVRERTRNAQSRLTFDNGRDIAPIWTPDSRRIVYASSRAGAQNLYWQPADGTGSAERLTTSSNDQWPYAITPDGKTLVYIEPGVQTNYDIYSLPLEGDRKPKALLATPFDERRPSLSPDGKWMVYQSNESGRFELFVRPFPNVDGGRWQVSAGGGSSPFWGPNGNEILYRQDQFIQRVEVSTSPSFRAGTPIQLFRATLPADSGGQSYSLSHDGKEFLAVRPVTGSLGPVEYRVVINWLEDVRARTHRDR